MITSVDYIVVGAGISGLSAAFEFEKNTLSGMVLEASDKTGGCVESVCTDDFHQELGAHSLFNSYGGVIKMIQYLSIEDRIIPKQKRSFLLWNQHKISSIFKALNLPLLFASAFKILWYKKTDKTVKQFYAAIVGKKNYTQVIRHALNAVACQDMDQAPANFLFQKRVRNKDFMRKFSFEKGLQTFVKALGKSLNIQHKTKVSNISLVDESYLVRTDQGDFYCKILLLAVPADVAAALVKNIDSDVFSPLIQIKTSRFNSVAVMVDKDKVNIDECAGWVGAQGDFYSMVSADPVNQSDKYRGFTFHFKPNQQDKEALVEKVQQMLKVDMKSIKRIIHKENTLPLIGEQHIKWVSKIDTALENKSLGLSGNYFYGMSLEDCVQRSFSEVHRLLGKA